MTWNRTFSLESTWVQEAGEDLNFFYLLFNLGRLYKLIQEKQQQNRNFVIPHCLFFEKNTLVSFNFVASLDPFNRNRNFENGHSS